MADKTSLDANIRSAASKPPASHDIATKPGEGKKAAAKADKPVDDKTTPPAAKAATPPIVETTPTETAIAPAAVASAEEATPPSAEDTTPGLFHDLDGRQRPVVEGISPEIDGGRFAIKRTVGETITVEADVFVDGHDLITCVLRYRPEDSAMWLEVPMQPLGNDRWRGQFKVMKVGRYRYTVAAWMDGFKSWRHDLSRRVQAEDIALALRVGAQMIRVTSKRATPADAAWLAERANALEAGDDELGYRVHMALGDDLGTMMERYADHHLATSYHRELAVVVDDERARFSTWYELFPRSVGPAGQHGTFKDVEAHLPRIADMGFDVLYFPPIHPIGRVNRKGKNNSLTAAPDDVGSPWAIGSAEGGHKAIHPRLGTLEDFHSLLAKARQYGVEIALDIAFQCAPDHPYVKEHPHWFRWRPDGTVQYAENPPKKYQDIYPFNFESDEWEGMWVELKSIFEYWIEQGVRIFRVDNPHTKPFGLWEWIITEVKRQHPTVLFLAEAFTRPRVMHRLAKLGFSQSYTYFSWRNTKAELTEYMLELTQTEGYDYFRPNFWPNTPDILPEYLQFGGRSGFIVRLILAATLASSYGIYGPAFELMEHAPMKQGSEEYLHSEKYEIKRWNLDRSGSLWELIALVNRIRRRNPALHRIDNLRFHPVSNEQIICYSKATEDFSDVILVAVNLDPHHVQAGWVELDHEVLGLKPKQSFEVHDLLSNNHYLWHGTRNFLELSPKKMPAHVFRLHQRTRTERDFDYFMG